MGKMGLGFALGFLICLLPTVLSVPSINDFAYKVAVNVTNDDVVSFSEYPIEVNISTAYMEQEGIDLAVFCSSVFTPSAVARFDSMHYGVRFKLSFPASSFNDSCAIYYGSTASLVNESLDWKPAAWNLYYNFSEMTNDSLDEIAEGYANWSIQPSKELSGQKVLKSADNISYFSFNGVNLRPYTNMVYYAYNTTPTDCGPFDHIKCVSVFFRENPTSPNYKWSRDNDYWFALPINSETNIFFGEGGGGFASRVKDAWQKFDIYGTYYEVESHEVIYGYRTYLNGTDIISLPKGAMPYEFYFANYSDVYAALAPFTGAEYHAVFYREYGENVSVIQAAEEANGGFTPPPEPTYAPKYEGGDLASLFIDTSAGLLVGFAQPAESIGTIIAVAMVCTLVLVGTGVILYGVFMKIPT